MRKFLLIAIIPMLSSCDSGRYLMQVESGTGKALVLDSKTGRSWILRNTPSETFILVPIPYLSTDNKPFMDRPSNNEVTWNQRLIFDKKD